jgi:hypothetical protein
MKKIFIYKSKCLFLGLLFLVALFQFSCEKEENSLPVISEIRAYLPTPDDSVLTYVEPGQYIVINGNNFDGIKSVLFNGYPSEFNVAYTTANHIVVRVPADIPFASLPTEKLNTIDIVTQAGQLSHSFPVKAPAPVIGAITNEMLRAGDNVTISGSFLFLIKKIIFPGNREVSEYSSNENGTVITLKVPAAYDGAPGPVTVETEFGTSSSTFKLHDPTGMLCNFDDVNNQNADNNVVNDDPTLFPGSFGSYGQFVFESAPANNWDDWKDGRGIRTTQVQWVPVENLDDPTTNWALKFEVFVKNPWSDGTIFIHDWSWKRTCRFEPWKNSPNPFKTTGWNTVTIPLSNFKSKANDADGTGSSASTVRELLENDGNGTDGKKYLVLLFNNPSKEVKDFNTAIDNLRIVRIKN